MVINTQTCHFLFVLLHFMISVLLRVFTSVVSTTLPNSVCEQPIGSLKVALVGNIYTTEFVKYCRAELFCPDSWLLNICQHTTGHDKHEVCRT